MDNLELPISLQDMSLVWEGKPEYLEETPEAQREPANSTNKYKSGIKPHSQRCQGKHGNDQAIVHPYICSISNLIRVAWWHSRYHCRLTAPESLEL